MTVPPRFTAQMIASEIYRGSSYGPKHPLRVPRVPVLLDLARALGWLDTGNYRTAPKAKPAALHGFHSPDYVAALIQAETTGNLSPETLARHNLGTLSNPLFPQVYSRPATGVGAVLLACELLAQSPAGRIHAPGGGTHHGMADRANGFCYLNDMALAVPWLENLGITRIAYIDIDAHHCDGVEAALLHRPSVRLWSVHEQGRWPFTGATGRRSNTVNMAVPPGFNDNEMAAVFDQLILPEISEYAPEIILLQAGADSLAEDPLSRLALSNRAYLRAMRGLLPLSPRFLLLGGGGYNPWSVGRLWTALWGELAGFDLPDHLPPSAQEVLADLSWGGGGRARPVGEMLTTLLDPPREGPVRPEIRRIIAACQPSN